MTELKCSPLHPSVYGSGIQMPPLLRSPAREAASGRGQVGSDAAYAASSCAEPNQYEVRTADRRVADCQTVRNRRAPQKSSKQIK
jgi:hypothetical protein